MRYLLVACLFFSLCCSASASIIRTAPDGRPSMHSDATTQTVIDRLTPVWFDAQWPARWAYIDPDTHQHGRYCPATTAIIVQPLTDAVGKADVSDTCSIRISPVETGVWACTVLTHEAGHLAGRVHTTTKDDVMNAANTAPYKPCEAWFDYTETNAPTRIMRAQIWFGWLHARCHRQRLIVTCQFHGKKRSVEFDHHRQIRWEL